MSQRLRLLAMAIVLALLSTATIVAADSRFDRDDHRPGNGPSVQLGPRPFYLVDQMKPGWLKTKLQQCTDRPFFYQSDLSIGHRGGGALQIPEHTKESHEAGARMGAGILECDVTFTSDGTLVCRHDQCDLHTTTNILVSPLASKCTRPFSAAAFDDSGQRTKAAAALCCTSDLTVDEFKTLTGKMDAFNPNATTPAEFLGGTPNWRTDLYATATAGTLLTHEESIRLLKSLGAKFTPELKSPNRNARLQVEEVFGSQENYAQAMIDAYKDAHIAPKDVFAQSFDYADILYWIQHEPRFGRQAVFLDDANVLSELPTRDDLQSYAAAGVKIVAPPMWALLTVDRHSNIVPSEYARHAKAAGLDIITWTLERSGRIREEVLPTQGTASPSFYYQTTLPALQNDGDILHTLDVLVREVGILGIFSDWAATVTFYANCMGIK